MRWQSLLGYLAMAAVSTTLPRLLFRGSGINAQGLSAMIGQMQALRGAQPESAAPATDGAPPPAQTDPSAGASPDAAKQAAMAQALLQGLATQAGPGMGAMLNELQQASGQGGEGQVLEQMQDLRDGKSENVSLEQMGAIQDAAQAQGAPDLMAQRPGARANAMDAMMKALTKPQPLSGRFKGSVLRDAEPVRRFYRKCRVKIQAAMVTAGFVVLAVAVLGAVSFFRGLARFLLGMVFGLSGRFLVMLSLGLASFFLASNVNPWPMLPPEVLAAPVGYMLVSSVFLRLLDPNYPVWNVMLTSMATPVACSFGVLAWIKYKPAVAAALAKNG